MTVAIGYSNDRRLGKPVIILHLGLKNADTQTGTAQTVSATRRYDAFGNVVTSSGIWNGLFGYRSGAEIPPNPEHRGEGNERRLVGRNRDAGGFGYQEDATGLKLLGHRIYDSSTGRFLTRDSIKDGRNWFVYSANDPQNRCDPSGLIAPLLIFGALALGAIIITVFDQNTGRNETDPNGNPVKIGGLLGPINPPQNAITINGAIHFKDQ